MDFMKKEIQAKFYGIEDSALYPADGLTKNKIDRFFVVLWAVVGDGEPYRVSRWRGW
jgi:hypothetical protein